MTSPANPKRFLFVLVRLKAFSKLLAIPNPTLNIRLFLFLPYATKEDTRGRKTLVKTAGAVDSPKDSTVKT